MILEVVRSELCLPFKKLKYDLFIRYKNSPKSRIKPIKNIADKLNVSDKNLSFVVKGFENLEKHIENIRKFNNEPVVAVNAFQTDSKKEIKYLIDEGGKISGLS